MNTTFGKVGNVLFKLLALVIFAAAGAWVASLIMGWWYSLEVSGDFVKWKSLESPQKFQEIVNVEHFHLRARADNGTIYAYTTEWKEWKPEPGDGENSGYQISSNCESVYGFAGVQSRYPPPEAVAPVECGISVAYHPLAGFVDMAYYVLLDNGEIWMWRHTRDPQQEIVIFLAGLFIGLIVGIIVWLMMQKWF